jgi:nicotinate-nucleotide adenylyltransferase
VKLGVLGGTFDPVHLGHIGLAEAALSCASLDRVLLVPASDPPHRDRAVAPAQDRLEMCRLAVRDHPRLQVSDLELHRGGRSYTADTLRQLKRDLPRADLFLILGWDAAKELPTWHLPGEVLRLAHLIIGSRPGYPEPNQGDLGALGLDPQRATLCRVRTPDAVATRIRELAGKGASLTGLVDPAVEAYIKGRHLYLMGA